MKYLFNRYLIIFSVCFLYVGQLQANSIRVAVASNFLIPMKKLVNAYQQATGEKVSISTGSTGKLFAQIVNGAPYDIFLAANSREPERLEKEGFAEAGSRFTYARGRLALWQPKSLNDKKSFEAVLKSLDYKRLSMAHPLTAPYGAAAASVLQSLDIDKKLRGKILRGENISQAYQYVYTNAAELGFVALSQLKVHGDKVPGQFWLVNEAMHTPILQQAVLLKSARKKIQANAFMNFLKSPVTQLMIKQFGYGLI